MATESATRPRAPSRLALVVLILAGGLIGAVLFRSEVPPSDSAPANATTSHTLIHRSPDRPSENGAEPQAALSSENLPAAQPSATSPEPSPNRSVSLAPAPTTTTMPRSEPRLLGSIEDLSSSQTPAAPPMSQPFHSQPTAPATDPWPPGLTDHRPLRPAPYAPRVGQTPQRTHKIVDGDTLYYLAERYLGSGERYLAIFEANRHVLSDPDILPIGRELRIPSNDDAAQSSTNYPTTMAPSPQSGLAPIPPGSLARDQQLPSSPIASEASSFSAQQPRTFHVRANDTLSDIARQVYGDARRHVDIYQANRDRLRGPNDLREGMVLVIP